MLFGFGNNKKVKEALASGAKVVDVRTTGEFATGHYSGAINIPLDQVPAKIDKIRALGSPLIVCCASGMRSGQAKGYLEAQGIETVYNAGPWTNLG